MASESYKLSLLKTALLGLALLFLGWMLHQVGWAVLGRYLKEIGWWWPALLLPYGLVTWLEAVSWEYLLLSPAPRPTLGLLFWLRLGGEALNTLTPTAGLGGEPFKAARLAALGIPWEEATASVIIHKGITFLSLVMYILLGLALAPFLLPLPGYLMWILSSGTLLLAGTALLFVFLQGRGPCLQGLRLLTRLGLCPRTLKDKEAELESLDLQMASFYRRHPRRAFLSLTLFFVAWLTHAAEVYLMFWLLGQPIGVELAICLDALAMLFTALGFFIPASLGVQDGGNVLLALGFHLGAPLGAAFSIIRRIREAFWMSLGLAFAAWRR